MAVGAAPWEVLHNKRRITKLPVNPLDRSTIVSIYPKDIYETKETVFPNTWLIKGAGNSDFELTVIGPSSWWKELSPDEPPLEIPVSSISMANSIINDWANGLDCCNMGDRKPGLFFVPGKHDKKSVMTYTDPETGKSFATMLSEAKVKQEAWYAELIKRADILWVRTSGNPLSVSELAKMAALKLGMRDKPWLKDNITISDMSPCPACGQMINKSFPVCANCKSVINKEKAKELGLVFAQ